MGAEPAGADQLDRLEHVGQHVTQSAEVRLSLDSLGHRPIEHRQVVEQRLLGVWRRTGMGEPLGMAPLPPRRRSTPLPVSTASIVSPSQLDL
jgi:hypothetical protein